MEFAYFGSDSGKDHNSGAYLFIPNGDAKVMLQLDYVQYSRMCTAVNLILVATPQALQYAITFCYGIYFSYMCLQSL